MQTATIGGGVFARITKKHSAFFSYLAARGYEGAAFYMGLYYQEGYGVKKDYDKARQYYSLGVLEDDQNCLNQLGVIYARGLGVKKDIHAALDYYKQAAEGGDALAAANVGWIYENGDLGKPNLEEAIRWYSYGAIGGDDHCKDNLRRLGVPIPDNHFVIREEEQS